MLESIKHPWVKAVVARAHVCETAGSFAEAEDYYVIAGEMIESFYGSLSVEYASILQKLSEIAERNGKRREAVLLKKTASYILLRLAA